MEGKAFMGITVTHRGSIPDDFKRQHKGVPLELLQVLYAESTGKMPPHQFQKDLVDLSKQLVAHTPNFPARWHVLSFDQVPFLTYHFPDTKTARSVKFGQDCFAFLDENRTIEFLLAGPSVQAKRAFVLAHEMGHCQANDYADPFDIKAEIARDTFAMQTMAKAHQDPQGAIDVLRFFLSKETDDSQRILLKQRLDSANRILPLAKKTFALSGQ